MKFPYLFTSCLFSLSSLLADIDTDTAIKSQPGMPQLDKVITIPLSAEETQKWQLGNMQVLKDGQAIFEWIHPKEDINNWSELIQIQLLTPADGANKQQAAADFATAFMDILKTQFPNSSAAIISQKNDDVLLEFSLPQAENNEEAQSELARIISTDSGLIRIAFTTKTGQMQDDLKKQWLEQLSNVTVTPSQTK